MNISPEEIKEIIEKDGNISNCSDDQTCLITFLVENFLKKLITETAVSCKKRKGKFLSIEDLKKAVKRNDYFFLRDLFDND